ncbi:Zinc-finger homeodomain protein 11 [Quillaja saponaria]|uniref:Zinc-finger homeodomain protein 11 n=1 Tax=Quillaja saponaria TaxID=32244 RepID=A0AAD7KPQ3_QUISA|nr:Zinc-finger homeodomain protein 11 [Quillaja saponaria]
MDLTIKTNKTLETDTQTPQQTATNIKSLSFTNGLFKRHQPTLLQPIVPPSTVVSFKECLKNHAASIGGHALDGCGEFMPSSTSNPTDPTSLKCAACGCHRNFHRRDTQDSNPYFLNRLFSTSPAVPPPPAQPPLPHRGLSSSTSPSTSPSPSPSFPSPTSSPSPPPVSHFPPSFNTSVPHMLLALGNAYSAPFDEHHRNVNQTVTKTENLIGKKRSRTKFSQEQKEKMYLFSEKVGWKLQKGEERLVQEFCNDVGVCKGVFKVWMHNNKNRRSEMGSDKINVDNGNGDRAADFDTNVSAYNINGIQSGNHQNENFSVNPHVSTNGSDSS